MPVQEVPGEEQVEGWTVVSALGDCFRDIATYHHLHKVGIQSRLPDTKQANPHKMHL